MIGKIPVSNPSAKRPEGALYEKKFNEDMTTEEIYNLLLKNSVKIKMPLDQHLTHLGTNGEGPGEGPVCVMGEGDGPPNFVEGRYRQDFEYIQVCCIVRRRCIWRGQIVRLVFVGWSNSDKSQDVFGRNCWIRIFVSAEGRLYIPASFPSRTQWFHLPRTEFLKQRLMLFAQSIVRAHDRRNVSVISFRNQGNHETLGIIVWHCMFSIRGLQLHSIHTRKMARISTVSNGWRRRNQFRMLLRLHEGKRHRTGRFIIFLRMDIRMHHGRSKFLRHAFVIYGNASSEYYRALRSDCFTMNEIHYYNLV